MGFKKMICVQGICVIIGVVSLFLLVGNVWAQCPPTGNPLQVSYTSQMSCGGNQNLSASGGCPPYNWSLSGGGTLTPGGGDNTTATYYAPASNANCADNPMIIVTDCCRNMACIQIAVNCYTPSLKAITFAGWGESSSCPPGQFAIWFCGAQWDCSGDLIWICNSRAVPDVGSPCGALCEYVVCWPRPYNPPTDCNTSQCGPWNPNPCGAYVDVRTAEMKNQGCCSLNPSTGLPIDAGIDCEGEAKEAGRRQLCQTENFVKNPINVATGNKYEEVLDLKVSTPGIPLEFRRSYNSKVIFNGSLGYGWTHTYDLSLAVVQTTPTKRVRIWDSDGRALYFYQAQQTSSEILFGAESGVKDRLKQVISTGEYFLRRKDGNLTYKLGSDGKLLQISDPNGNTQTVSYTGGLLTQVSDNFGRSLSLQYSNNRISSVTDPKNQSVSYQYQNGDLWKVTYPDMNSITYAYSNHNLTDKYDTNNNLIGHWGYDNRHRVANYYSHIKDGVHQEEINLTYQAGAQSSQDQPEQLPTLWVLWMASG